MGESGMGGVGLGQGLALSLVGLVGLVTAVIGILTVVAELTDDSRRRKHRAGSKELAEPARDAAIVTREGPADDLVAFGLIAPPAARPPTCTNPILPSDIKLLGPSAWWVRLGMSIGGLTLLVVIGFGVISLLTNGGMSDALDCD